MNISIKHKIWMGFALILAIVFAMAGVSFISMTSTKATVNKVVLESQPLLIAVQNMSANLNRSQGAIGNFLLTKSDKERQNFQNSMYEAQQNLEEMGNLDIVKNDAQFQQHVDSFQEGLTQYQSFENQLIKLSKNSAANYPAFDYASENINPKTTELLTVLGQMIGSESEEEVTEERRNWLNQIQQVRYNTVKLMSTVRIYLQSPEEFAKTNMLSEVENLVPLVDKMKQEQYSELYTFEQEEGVVRVEELVSEFTKGINQLIILNSSEKRRMDVFIFKTKMTPIMFKIDEELQNLTDHLLEENQKQGVDLIDSVNKAKVSQLVVTVIGLIIGIVVAYVISRMILSPLNETVSALEDLAEGEGDLTRRLNEKNHDEIGQLASAFNRFAEKVQSLVSDVQTTAVQLSNSASEMDATADKTQADISNQSQQIEMVAQAVNSMTQQIQDVANNTGQAATLAEQTNSNASEGKAIVDAAVNSSQSLASNVEQAATVINTLENDAEAIGGVLEVIRGIAEQTNLLALNAAIEAARAGEQGRGFAVVADEVRTLASRTGESTEEIQKMIEKLQSGSRHAVQVMTESKAKASESVEHSNHAGDSLNNIAEAANGMLEMNREIANSSEQQEASAGQVNQSVDSIKSLSQQTQQSATSMADSSSHVSHLAQQLQNLLSQFKV